MVIEGLKGSINKFHRWLRHPAYMGWRKLETWEDQEEEWVRMEHEPLISEDLFHRVQMLLQRDGKDTRKKTKVRREYPLKGHLNCRLCGNKMTGSASKGRTRYTIAIITVVEAVRSVLEPMRPTKFLLII